MENFSPTVITGIAGGSTKRSTDRISSPSPLRLRGDFVIPLAVRLVGKQGRANTQKPKILVGMMAEIVNFFSSRGIDITEYPISFDSWYGSQPLREDLQEIGFSQILVHAKSNYVFTLNGQKAKLSCHKRDVEVKENQWGCQRPVCRAVAESPTFGEVVLLFFVERSQVRCMIVFGRPLRAGEILRIWRQHHGIEQFWRNLKSIVHLNEMRLHGRDSAYAGLAVKVLSYLLRVNLAEATDLTFHQIVFGLSGQRSLFERIVEHFHPPNASER